MDMFTSSFLAGMLSTMNVFAFKFNHVRFTVNDLYMIMLMVGWMMLFHTLTNGSMKMDRNSTLMISIILIVTSFYFIRNQSFVNDNQFLNSMIPHHSMAILMANRIKTKTKDPRIVELANSIINAQTNEIEYMKELVQNPRF